MSQDCSTDKSRQQDTPRTNGAIGMWCKDGVAHEYLEPTIVDAGRFIEFARQLERELEVARENGYAAGRASTLTVPMSSTSRACTAPTEEIRQAVGALGTVDHTHHALGLLIAIAERHARDLEKATFYENANADRARNAETALTLAPSATASASGDVFLCRASGEGSQDFRICPDEAAVYAFYEEMTGRDQDGTLDSITKSFHDTDYWGCEGRAFSLDLYMAKFEVWKVQASELCERSDISREGGTK